MHLRRRVPSWVCQRVAHGDRACAVGGDADAVCAVGMVCVVACRRQRAVERLCCHGVREPHLARCRRDGSVARRRAHARARARALELGHDLDLLAGRRRHKRPSGDHHAGTGERTRGDDHEHARLYAGACTVATAVTHGSPEGIAQHVNTAALHQCFFFSRSIITPNDL